MKKIFLILFLLLSSNIYSEIIVDALVDYSKVTLDEGLTFTIRVRTDQQLQSEIEIPDMSILEEEFQLGTQYQSTSISQRFTDGSFVSERLKYYKYKIFPLSVGKKTIPSFEIKIGSRVFKTKPIEIEAVASSRGSQQQQYQSQNRPHHQQPRANVDNFFIKAVPDKTSVYVGEQIIVSYYLFTRSRIDNPNITSRPTFSGFIKEDLADVKSLDFSVQVFNGVEYNRALLGKYALYPLKEGKAIIDQMSISALVYRENEDEDQFGMGSIFNFLRPIEVNKQSDKIPVNVKPLPTLDQPVVFSGAVGSFDIKGKLSTNDTKMGQPVSFIVTIKGRGNFSAMEKPALNLGSDIEIYDSKSSVDVSPLGLGEATFEYVLIPRSEGELKVGPLDFSFFNTDSKAYKTISVGPYSLNVKGGVASSYTPSIPSSPASTAPVATVKAKANDIRYIKSSGGKNSYNLLNQTWYYAMYFVVIFLVLLINIFIYKKNQSVSAMEKAKNKANSLLKQAKQSKNSEEIISYTTDAVLTMIAGALNVSHHGERHDDLLEKYAKATGNTELVTGIKNLLNDAYKIKYSGSEFVLKEKDKFLDGVELMIKKIVA